jgi:NADP-dependent aldehyde dehydrogenase
MDKIADSFKGHLTVSIHFEGREIESFHPIVRKLEDKVGRIVFNGFPTGVEVCPSMQHGGPYPATTDSRMTSVGTAAIQRFVRPICYQDCPERLLPDELKNQNSLRIWRLVENQHTKDDAEETTTKK